MTRTHPASTRRRFLKTTATFATGLSGISISCVNATSLPFAAEESWSIIGPREGFSPQVGTLHSMLNMMRHIILNPVQGLTMEQLDFLFDVHSNTIGAMLLHLAATETYYQCNTFQQVKWGTWSEAAKKKWDIPMKLGDDGRKHIKGHNLDYYLDILTETREKTIEEFKKRDDDWLMVVDPEWGWNNYAKWFHVAEHESNHNGQIKWIKSRLPGNRPGAD